MTKMKTWLLKPQALFSPMKKNSGMLLGLAEEGDRLAAGQAGDDAAADEEDGQRRDEGRNAQHRDQRAVDEPDEQSDGQGPDDRRKQAAVEIGRREGDRKDRRGQPVERADRQIEILVDDDEGHADRHHAVARGVAHDRGEGGGRAEEFGVDVDADQVEQDHENDQADFPSADQSRAEAGGELGGEGAMTAAVMRPRR